MAKASTDSKFKGELDTIESCESCRDTLHTKETYPIFTGFKVLTESERTTTLYTLVEQANEDQLQFLMTAIQKKIPPQEEPKVTREHVLVIWISILLILFLALRDSQAKSRPGKPILRPPLLNLDEPPSPSTPTPNTAANPNIFAGLPNDTQLFAGLSNEAQLLAAQLIMSGVVKPAGVLQQHLSKSKKATPSTNWRTTPISPRYPASALRSSTRVPPSALKSAALKSSGLDSASFMATPREEDFDPEMLKDIPGWLRGLRLHKYTQCFDGLTWEEMVVLDDATLEARGVAALGARRRLLRTFEHVRKRMGMEEPNSATPTTSMMPTPGVKSIYEHDTVPHSAFPRSKLSINSPIFTPREAIAPHSAVPAIVSTPASEAPATIPEPTEAPKAIEVSAATDAPATTA